METGKAIAFLPRISLHALARCRPPSLYAVSGTARTSALAVAAYAEDRGAEGGRAGAIHTHAGKDLVIHCGGPFQKRTRCEVLEAAIDAGEIGRAHV